MEKLVSLFREKLEQLKSKKNESLRRFVFLLLTGICLMVILWPFEDEDEEIKTPDNEAEYEEEESGDLGYGTEATYDEYVSSLEEKLSAILEGVKGVGRTEVMITLKDGGEKIVEKDVTSSESQSEDSTLVSSSEETVTVNNDDGTSPYVSKVLEPEIEGVVVACEGGGDSEIAVKITEVVQALFDVPAHKIVVLEQK